MLCKPIEPRGAVLSRGTIFAFTVLATTAWTPVALASEFPAIIPLSSLDGTTGSRLDGEKPGDNSGVSVAGAGDVNGDGFGDLIIGARLADPHGTYSGSSYVVFGKESGFGATLSLSTLDGNTGFRLDGAEERDLSGWSVASAGDINSDGFADLIVGAPIADPHGAQSGSAYVVFGKPSGFSPRMNLSELNGSDGFQIDGLSAYDRVGSSVASAGDVNGDGFADILLGAPGRYGHAQGLTYVLFGKAGAFGKQFDLSSLDGTNGFRLDGANKIDRSGRSVASAGDVNGDGFADLIVGAPEAEPQDRYSGSSYVVFGKAAGFTPTLNLSALDGSNGFRIDGREYDRSGISVASAGDVNGDGFADLVIGAFGARPHGTYSGGSTYVVFGKVSGFAATIDLSSLTRRDGFRADGIADQDSSGYSVSGAGDVNADGFADVIIGARGADSHGTNSGSSYVVFGKAAPLGRRLELSSLDGTNGFRLDGVSRGDYSGHSVASAGDFNGDGFADLIVGAFKADPRGAGSSYVVFGRAPDTAVKRHGAGAGQYVSGGPFDDVLQGRNGDDVVEGRGGSDKLKGGGGEDAASYAHAPAGVTASLANPNANTGDAAGDSYDATIEGLIGSRFDDRLSGNASANRITGGLRRDTLAGGGGNDTFVYTSTIDSPPGPTRDLIIDFDPGTAATSVDKIDLSAIDAKLGPGNQAFTFIGTAPFSNTQGELRIRQNGSSAVVMGDVNGDSVADFEIALSNISDLSTLTGIDFRL